MKALVDNDVILKCAYYALLDVLLAQLPPADATIGILGSARYVLRDLLQRRSASSANALEVLTRVIEFIDEHGDLEPTAEEISLAAEFEALAQSEGLALDSGESVLCAIAIMRQVPYLITGDKRAIAAIEVIGHLHSVMHAIRGRIMCLEQLILRSLTKANLDMLRDAICANPEVDKAVFNCCSCSSEKADLEVMQYGLNSYISSLRRSSEQMLSI